MNENLYSELSVAFNDAYCDDRGVGVAKLYAAIQLESDRLLRAYIEMKEEAEDEQN